MATIRDYLDKFPNTPEGQIKSLVDTLNTVDGREHVLDDAIEAGWTPAQLVNAIRMARLRRQQEQASKTDDEPEEDFPDEAQETKKQPFWKKSNKKKSTSPANQTQDAMDNEPGKFDHAKEVAGIWGKRFLLGLAGVVVLIGFVFAGKSFINIPVETPTPIITNPTPASETLTQDTPRVVLPETPGILDRFLGSNTVKFRILRAPETLDEILSNSLGWIVLLCMTWLLIINFRSEADDRKEPKDYQAVMRGLIFFLIIYALADAIALKTLQLCNFLGQSCVGPDIQYWSTVVIRGIGAAFLVGSGFAAATGGNWDASPISVSLFLLGTVILVTLNPWHLIGTIVLISGILVHLYEIWRHPNQRAPALVGTAVIIALSLGIAFFITAGVNAYPAFSKYRLLAAYLAVVFVALGAASGVVPKKVSAVFPGGLRENIPDVDSPIYFDIKLVTLMGAITYLIL